MHSLLALSLIRVGGKRFRFLHNTQTDGRELYDQEDNLVLEVEADLQFRDKDGRVGDLNNDGGEWVFYYGPLRTRFKTGVMVDRPGRSYCWENLEKAEVEAIKHYLESKLPKIKRGDDTEGGSCD